MSNNQIDTNNIIAYEKEGRKAIHKIADYCREIQTQLNKIEKNLNNINEIDGKRYKAYINENEIKVPYGKTTQYTVSADIYKCNKTRITDLQNSINMKRNEIEDILSKLHENRRKLIKIENSANELQNLLNDINDEANSAVRNAEKTNINWGDILFATSAATTGAEDEFSAQNGTGNGIDPNNKYLYNATLRFRKASEFLSENNPGRETNSYVIEKYDETTNTWVPMKWISEGAMIEVLEEYKNQTNKSSATDIDEAKKEQRDLIKVQEEINKRKEFNASEDQKREDLAKYNEERNKLNKNLKRNGNLLFENPISGYYNEETNQGYAIYDSNSPDKRGIEKVTINSYRNIDVVFDTNSEYNIVNEIGHEGEKRVSSHWEYDKEYGGYIATTTLESGEVIMEHVTPWG